MKTGFYAFVCVVALVAFGGWCANVVKFVGMLGGDVTAMFIARLVGVVAAPVGSILGFF